MKAGTVWITFIVFAVVAIALFMCALIVFPSYP